MHLTYFYNLQEIFYKDANQKGNY